MTHTNISMTLWAEKGEIGAKKEGKRGELVIINIDIKQKKSFGVHVCVCVNYLECKYV